MPVWIEGDDIPTRRDFDAILAEVQAETPDYPDMWAEIARYAAPYTAGDRAYRLNLKHSPDGWTFRSVTDPDTGEGIVYAKWKGTDRDVVDSQD